MVGDYVGLKIVLSLDFVGVGGLQESQNVIGTLQYRYPALNE